MLSRSNSLVVFALLVGVMLPACQFTYYSKDVYKAEVRPDTAVRILAERAIPYGGKHNELQQVMLPDGDLIVLRTVDDDSAIFQRLDQETFAVKWERPLLLTDVDSWSPELYYDETDSSVSLCSTILWADEDSVGLSVRELDPRTGVLSTPRWLLRLQSKNDSSDVRTGYGTIRSEDESKVMFYYMDYRGVTETSTKEPKTIEVVFEVFDQKFKKLGEGRIRRELPWEVGSDEDEIAEFYRGTIVDNVGNVFVVNLMTPNKIQVTKHFIESGRQRTLQVDYPGVDVLYKHETYGGMAFTSDHVDNLYLAAPWLVEENEVGGVILAKFNFNTMNIPVATGVKFTEEQAEALVGRDGLKFYAVRDIYLDEGTAVVHLGHSVKTTYTGGASKWVVYEEKDVLLLGFDQQGNALYQTVLKKHQMSNRFISTYRPEIGYRVKWTAQGLRFYYIDRSYGGIVTRLFDAKSGALTVPYQVLNLGMGTAFLKECTYYDRKHDQFYFTLHYGVGSENARVYKVAMTDRLLRKAEKIY